MEYPHEMFIKKLPISSIRKVLFYPKSSILAILKEEVLNSIIEYVDINLKTCLRTLEIPCRDYSKFYDLSFSPDTTKLLVTCDNTCVIVPVPWQINKPYYGYLILKNYQFNEQELPNDIIRLLMDMVFSNIQQTSKFKGQF